MIKEQQIASMTISERLQAMEQLWDSLCRESPEMASSGWHRAVLADRKARAERGEPKFVTMAQLKARLRKLPR